MKNSENSKAVSIGAIAVVLMMAWQMRTHPVGTVKVPEKVPESSTPPGQNGQKRQPSAAPDSPTPASAAKKEKPPQGEKDNLLQEIRVTRECYASEACDFPHTDPKSYEIAVGQKLKNLLKEYRTQFGAEPQNFTEMQSLALEFVLSQDQYLQEEALTMFAALPTASENLQAMTQGLSNTTDPLLVDQAMNEMKRYVGTSDEPLVHDYLRALLEQGGVFSSEAAAKKILSFINSQSYPGYERLARSLPPHATVGQNLRTALAEYLRLQSGG